jgi:hypothetical protein
VHATAGERLEHREQTFTSCMPRRRGRICSREGAEEGQVAGDAHQLAQQGAQPGGAGRHLQAQHALDGEGDPDLAAGGPEPVVPIGQHEDLPVVAHLEQLLHTPVHIADDRLSGR